MKVKKLVATGLSLILAAGIVTGCSGEPGKKETRETLERLYGGESFEVDDGMAYSLDRDLEFSYYYDWEGTPIWPDIDINLGGKYIIKTTYNEAVHHYWNKKYRKCIKKYDFEDVDYGTDGKDKDKCSPNMVYIFIEDGASEEDLENVESLLLDLRDICEDEEEFHSSKCSEMYSYVVYIWYIDDEAEEYQKTTTVKVKANTPDKHLKLDNIKIATTEKSDPRDNPLSHGNAMIFVN